MGDGNTTAPPFPSPSLPLELQANKREKRSTKKSFSSNFLFDGVPRIQRRCRRRRRREETPLSRAAASCAFFAREKAFACAPTRRREDSTPPRRPNAAAKTQRRREDPTPPRKPNAAAKTQHRRRREETPLPRGAACASTRRRELRILRIRPPRTLSERRRQGGTSVNFILLDFDRRSWTQVKEPLRKLFRSRDASRMTTRKFAEWVESKHDLDDVETILRAFDRKYKQLLLRERARVFDKTECLMRTLPADRHAEIAKELRDGENFVTDWEGVTTVIREVARRDRLLRRVEDVALNSPLPLESVERGSPAEPHNPPPRARPRSVDLSEARATRRVGLGHRAVKDE
ncbi:MAG: hypothetical protein BJ554DRAFT_783, partial [Olpidium bornovanus]